MAHIRFILLAVIFATISAAAHAGYVRNDPINNIDPFGTQTVDSVQVFTNPDGTKTIIIEGDLVARTAIATAVAGMAGVEVLKNENADGQSLTPQGRPIRDHGKKGSGGEYLHGKGWTPEAVDDVIENPVDIEPATDKQPDRSTGGARNQPATKYYGSGGRGVVVNDETGEVIAADGLDYPPPRPDLIEEQ